MSTILLRLGRGCTVPARPRQLSPLHSVAHSEVGGGQAVPCEAGMSPPGWCSRPQLLYPSRALLLFGGAH